MTRALPTRPPQPPIPKPAKSPLLPERHVRPGYETPAISAGANAARRVLSQPKLAWSSSGPLAGFYCGVDKSGECGIFALCGAGTSPRQVCLAGPLQPRRMHWSDQDASHGEARSEARFNVVCRTSKSQHPNGQQAHDEAEQCVFKKAENHAHMMAIYFMHYNFVRIHQTLKITPAMQATKMGELHSNLAKAAFRPAEQVIAAMQGTK